MPIVRMPDGTQVRFPDEMSREEIRGILATKFPDAVGQGAAPRQPATSPQGPTIRVGDRQIALADYRAMSDGERQALRDQIAESGTHAGTGSSALDPFVQGVTFGWADEGRGVVQGALAAAQGGDFGDTYRRTVDEARGALALERRVNPWGSLGAEIAGAIPTGVAAGGQLAARGAGLASRMFWGGLAGVGQGAVYGAGAAGEGSRDSGAMFGGATGLGVGAAIPAIAQGFRGLFQRTGGVMPEIDDLYRAKDAAYKQVDQSGFRYSPQQIDTLFNDMYRRVGQGGIDTARDGAHKAAIRMLERLNARQGPMTLGQLDQLRQVIRRDVIESGTKGDGHFGGLMLDAIDDFIEKAGGSEVITAARTAHRTVRKSELLAEALEKANLNAASSGSGGNIDNAIRQQIKGLLTNKSNARSFTEAERELMRKIVEGKAPLQGFLRLVGKLSPGGNGLMAALGVGATAVNPLMAIPVGAGMAARRLADRPTIGGAQALQQTVRTGGAPPPPLPAPGLLQRGMQPLAPYFGGRIGETVSGGGAW